MSARDLVEGEALLDDEEDDEDFDEETGEIREGFIVDEEEEEEQQERRRERRKRRREERDREDEELDEEDLDLIGEKPEEPQESKFKRLKRGPRDARESRVSRGIDDIFDESDEDEAPTRGTAANEFDDFIEEDVFSDEERERQREDEEVARPARRGFGYGITADTTGLDEQALDDMRRAFGDGSDYYFALEKEDQQEEIDEEQGKHLDLKDVFEPSQLVEKMMTEEDQAIRNTDEPERCQIARKPYRHVTLTEEQFKEEGQWISNLMLPKRALKQELHEPFRRAVAKVLELMVAEDFEVPFIFHNRKDYLIHALKKPVGKNKEGEMEYEIEAAKLLNQSDLWEIFEQDLKFRAFIDKRNTIQKTYDNLVSTSISPDEIFESMLPAAVTMEELQDVQDYLYFQYSSQLKDLTASGAVETNGDGVHRKKAVAKSLFERVRGGKAYNLVRAFGISANGFAQNALKQGVKNYTEDPSDRPDDMADSIVDTDFQTGSHALKAAKTMFVEELVTSPRMRNVIRQAFYTMGVVECYRTEKGLRKIDEHHPYYDFKYLRNQELNQILGQPELYLKMLQAENEGLIEVRVRLQNAEHFTKNLHKHIVSDNFSEVADAWNRERIEVVDAAVTKLSKLMSRLVKENLRAECENLVARTCREEFARRLDQAPYQPKGMKKGIIPRVLAMSIGKGTYGRDSIVWAWVNEEGRVLENGKFVDLSPGDKERGLPDGKDVVDFVEVVRRREPDVIGISGFSPETRKLYTNLMALIKERDLRGAEYTDENDREVKDPLEVIIVNDEIARLYQTSERAKLDHPSFAPLTHYCVALAKYMQDPMKEYAALGSDLASIMFAPGQQALDQKKLLHHLETVLVDHVNMCGVSLNDAISDMATANLLPYVAGLGHRKASHMLKVINMNGGAVNNRSELIGIGAERPAMGTKVWANASSFLYLEYDAAEPESEYLDGTRIHPEDYDIARKMAADALELDEEDIQAETDENGAGAIVRKLIKDDAQDRVNDLILEEYAEQLERNLNQRKRATLENIRAELIEPYEELRQPFMTALGTDEIFTMFTGETRDTLERGMIVPISIKRVMNDHIDAKLDCGIDVYVGETELSDRFDMSVKQMYSVHQTIQAKLLSLDRKNFTANCSLREEQLKRPYRKYNDRMHSEWDDRQEAADQKLLEEKTDGGGRATRVIKHPLFRPFNSAQAEEYLGSQNRGDVVIRPSSLGVDHLAVTWKVSDGVFQHIDVLELDKENDFALGKTLKIGGRYTYSDLDELIVLHVKAMAKKVDEMMTNEKYQNGSKADTDRWLTTYTEANPKRSVYAFCINPKYPGYFYLCFKAGQHGKLQNWPVKVIPQGFELQKNPYPSMRDLTNGFKLLYTNLQNGMRR
ncbi:putative transcription elongation factor spt6 [Phaeomoniella chlamydospora]|uniref:Transcription elongation factor Spt6 n=1 Tax=Phaeomoniella chlamydospora TaxID=158046 RepID=A0A0G2EYZ0_PHACM|nr:putative transcription elongation factor spt6 [Phaeomoniella chlamydospora]